MITVEFFSNGSTMAFENGKQVPLAQEPWILCYANYLASVGIDPTKVRVLLPNGADARITKDVDEDTGQVTHNWHVGY